MALPALPDPALDVLSARVVQACAEVHRRLGPGLPREAYLHAVCHELTQQGIGYQRRVSLPVFYRGFRLDAAYEIDVCVEARVAVDVRAVPALLPVHRSELRARLRVGGLDAGVLVNFHAARFGERVVIVRRPGRRARFEAELAQLDLPTLTGPPRAA